MEIVRQRDAKDCGVSSLLSIIKHYGGYVSLEKLRLDTNTTINGTTALNIIEASKQYGFDAVGKKVNNLTNEAIFLPAIVHVIKPNGLNHFVVIYKITSNKVILMDPAKGKVVMTKDEFYEEWTHVILLFKPRRKIPVLQIENSLFKIFTKIVVQEKSLFITILIVSILLIIFTVISGYHFQIMIDAITNNYYLTYIKILGIFFGIIVIFKLIFKYIRGYLEVHLNKNIDCFLNSNFINHIFNLPLEVITSRNGGEIITRVNELNGIKNLFTEIFISCFLDFLLMITAMPLLYNISDKLFLAFLFSLLLYLIVGLISSRIIYKRAYANIELSAGFNNVLLENINMLNSIKNLNVIDKSLKNIENSLTSLLYDNFRLSKFINNETMLKNTINEISYFIINTWGFYLIFQGTIEITSLVTFNMLLTFFLDPIKNCIDSLPRYNYIKASFSKINDFLSLNKESLGKSINIKNNGIVINNLNYSYDKLTPIFKNFNLIIQPGEVVTIKGKSGTGKSTLCKILDKYIINYGGHISIGEYNIRDLSINTIRNNITYINQNESLCSGTIKENIVFGRNIDDDKFYEVCQICLVDEIVNKKDFRYDTSINNENVNISGGEKQRIILARALLNNFEILILDEALSEVDYRTEKQIIKNIKNRYRGKTIIYVTHKNQDRLFDKVINLGGHHGV